MTQVTRPKPSDATGVARARALKDNADEVQRRADEITLASATEAKRLATEVFDPKVNAAPIIIDEVEELGVGLADDTVIVRTIANIEGMTYGYGNVYNFTAGVKYRVPREVADALTDLGYI
jgi:hypothetical protein